MTPNNQLLEVVIGPFGAEPTRETSVSAGRNLGERTMIVS